VLARPTMPMAIVAVEQLKTANKTALVVGLRAGKEVLDLHQVRRYPRQRDAHASRGCRGVEIAPAICLRAKQPVRRSLF